MHVASPGPHRNAAGRRMLLVLFALAVLVAGTVLSEGPAAAQPTDLQVRGHTPMLARDGYHGTVAYTVQPGDTLFSLARRFGTTVATIAALNGIGDTSVIEVGEHLLIPSAPEPPPPTGPSALIRNGSRSSSLVALTFDMGGRVDPAVDIMNWLVANGIRATIFMTGAMIENPNTDAGRTVLQIVDEHPALFDLGNHSYSHPDFRELSGSEIWEELHSTEDAASVHTARSMRPWFRPPYGAYDQRVLNIVGEAGYPYTVMWDVDTIDWLPVADGGPTAGEIVAKVVNNAQGGSIVLMHLGGYNTLEALPGIVAGLTARGFSFGRLSDVQP